MSDSYDRDLGVVETIRGSFWIVLSSVVVNVFGLIFWIFCSKFIQVKYVGYATTAFSLAFMISALVNFGFGYVILREVPIRGSRILSATLTIATIVGLTSCLTLTPFKSLYVNFDVYVLLAMVIVVVSLINAVLSNTFIALLKAHFYFTISTLIAVSKLVLVILFVSLLNLNGLAIMLAIATSSLLAFTIALTLTYRLIGFSKFSLDDVKCVFKVGLSNYPQVLSTQLLTSTGIILLATLTGNPMYAGIAYIILMATLAVSVIPSSLAIAGLPIMVTNTESIEKISNEGFRIGLGIVTPIIIFLGISSNTLLSLLKPEYVIGSFPLTICILSVPFIFSNTLVISRLNAEGKFKEVAYIGLLRLLTLVCLSIVLTKLDPLLGIVISFLISNVVTIPLLKSFANIDLKLLALISLVQTSITMFNYVMSIKYINDLILASLWTLITLVILDRLNLLKISEILTILQILLKRRKF